MRRSLIAVAFLCCGLALQSTGIAAAATVNPNQDTASLSTIAVNPVIEWNRTLLVIVRTPGAQSPTIHNAHFRANRHRDVLER